MGRFLMRIWAAITLLLTVGFSIAAGFQRHGDPIEGFFAGLFISLALLAVGAFFYVLLKIIFGSDD